MTTPDTETPQYAAYRRAVLNRNDEEALKILARIVDSDPSDANAASELSRLDAKVLAARLQHLGASVEGNDSRLIVTQVEAIETFGFRARPEGDVWRKAQAIRCGVLLEETAKLKNSSQWQGALGKIDLIRHLQKDLKLELPADSLKQLAALETWALAEKEKDRKEREFQALLSELHLRIHQSEEKDTSARYVELPELRDDYEGLHKVWRSLTDFVRPIPEESTSAFRKRSALLEAEIYRRTAIQRRLITAGFLAVLLVIAGIVWIVTAKMKAHLFNRQLQQAIAYRQVHAAEHLLDEAHRKKIGDADTVAATETFVTQEDNFLANYQADFKQLPQTFPNPPDAATLNAIAGRLVLAQDALNALAPDLKAENQPALQAFEQNWQNYLAASGDAVNKLLEQWVSAAEKQSADLDFGNPLPIRSQLDSLSRLLQQANDCQTGYEKNIKLRNDLVERLAAVQTKFNAYQGELNNVDNGFAEVQKARTLAEFSNGIKLVASSEFSTAGPVAAASAIQSLDISDKGALQYLLNATNADTWAFIQKSLPPNFIPGIVMPAEKQTLQDLNKDPAVSANHQHYRLWLDSGGNNVEDWITEGALDTTTGWKTIPAWTMSADATSAIFSDHDYGYFDGQYKLSPTQPIYNLQQVGSSDETASFHDVGVAGILADDNTCSRPLLQVLDAIKNSQEGSPLFRAWLFSQLVDLMNLRPDEWGVSFCPAIQAHYAQIRAITGGTLADGDWFVPSKVNAWSQKLDQFFAAARPVSYEKQAAGIFLLEQAAAKDGLQYTGYIGLDGKPVFLEGTKPSEFFGYSSASKGLVLVTAAGSSVPQVMPLSPLFTTALSREGYLANARVNPDDPSFQGVLPPLFQNLTH